MDGVYQVTASVPGPGASSYTDTQSLTVASTPVEPDPVFRPDAAIRRAGEAYVGGDVYGGAMRQRVIAELGEQQARARFFVRLQNDGTARDRITVRGIRSHPAFHVVYRIGGRNVTRGVIAGTYRTVRLAPGASVKLSVTVIRTSRSRPGDHRIFRVRATSARNGQRRDVVAAVVRIPSAG
ncbi:unannotated protein [freshwater metagenome]|uniref:Unannotated protein n=1 Tax=freshwater metagenome TaxID=449393 RepID=A0A6J6RH27_9ZZZZ